MSYRAVLDLLEPALDRGTKVFVIDAAKKRDVVFESLLFYVSWDRICHGQDLWRFVAEHTHWRDGYINSTAGTGLEQDTNAAVACSYLPL
jgi:hypothetical protein